MPRTIAPTQTPEIFKIRRYAFCPVCFTRIGASVQSHERHASECSSEHPGKLLEHIRKLRVAKNRSYAIKFTTKLYCKAMLANGKLPFGNHQKEFVKEALLYQANTPAHEFVARGGIRQQRV